MELFHARRRARVTYLRQPHRDHELFDQNDFFFT